MGLGGGSGSEVMTIWTKDLVAKDKVGCGIGWQRLYSRICGGWREWRGVGTYVHER